MIVPTPTMMASWACRSCCTWARATSLRDPPPGCAPAAERRRMMQLAGRRSDLAVQRHGRLERDQRGVLANVFGEGFI